MRAERLGIPADARDHARPLFLRTHRRDHRRLMASRRFPAAL
jgi:hypothetical protein